MGKLDFALLGPLLVRHAGRPVDLGKPMRQALLGVLLLNPNEVVPAERLIEDLWDGDPPGKPMASLQAHVSRLRAALVAVDHPRSTIFSQASGYQLAVGEEGLDALRFRSLAHEGRAALARGELARAVEGLGAALAVWRGRVLSGLSFGPLARAEIASLENLRLAVVEDLVEARMALGQHAEVLAELESVVAEHPLRERLWGQRMLALYRCGRQTEALRAYRELRRTLAEEVGIDPGPELRALEEAILLQRPELAWVAPGPASSPVAADALSSPATPGTSKNSGSSRPGNLSLPLTAFVGRAAELAEVRSRLGELRLVTLTGPGGCGKTRLALQVARTATGFPDGTWLVDLSSSTDVERAAAASLGVHEEPRRRLLDTLVDAFRPKDVLLVLDNCEHVLAACRSFATAVLQHCPDVRILATSREPLGVPGELHWPVPALSLPPLAPSPEAIASSDAVQLLVDRASLVRPDFRVTPANALAVASICHKLDGIALAIELAAARLAALTAEQVEARLVDGFRLLADQEGARPERHRTLRATMEWSDALLALPERALLWRLSVFAGGFGLDAAEEVCAGGAVERPAVIDHLSRLVGQSLVVADTTGREARFRLLAAIRSYGGDRLEEAGETTALRRHHAWWCLALAERAEPELTGPAQGAWLDRLDAEHDNVRAALAWSLGRGESETTLRLAGAMALYWRLRGHLSEGREWLDTSLASCPDASDATLAKALRGAGCLAALLLDHGSAVGNLERSLALSRQLGDIGGCARSMLFLADSRRHTDGPLVGLLLVEESVELAREAGDLWCLGHALAVAGAIHFEQGRVEVARALLDEGLAVSRRAGDHQGTLLALWVLGRARMVEGQLGQAEAVLSEGLGVSRQLGEPYATAAFLGRLAEVFRARGDHERAGQLVEEALPLATATSPTTLIDVLCYRGNLALDAGDVLGARQAFQEASTVGSGAGETSVTALRGLGEVAHALGDRGESARLLDEALGWSRSAGNRQETALTLEALGRLAAADQREGEAWSLHGEALALYREAGDVPGTARSFEALAALAARSGPAEEAATLFGAAEAFREATGGAVPPRLQAWHEGAVARVRQALGPERCGAAWAAGTALSPAGAADLAAELVRRSAEEPPPGPPG